MSRLLSRLGFVCASLLALSGCATSLPGLAPGQSFPVFFTNAATMPDDQGRAVVDQAVAWANRYPSEQIKVTGYADPRAPEQEVTRLATRRADEIAALLEEKGVSPDRIKRAIGDDTLLGPSGASGLGNRRVDILVGL
jgi:outer membrane protein OmpA-like peptidoglycan-associated protein